MFCQLNHLLDVVMFDLRSAGAGKPPAGGVCKDGALLCSQQSWRGSAWEGGEATSPCAGEPKGPRSTADPPHAATPGPEGDSTASVTGVPTIRSHADAQGATAWPCSSSALGTASQLGPCSVPCMVPGAGRAEFHQKALVQPPLLKAQPTETQRGGIRPEVTQQVRSLQVRGHVPPSLKGLNPGQGVFTRD